MLNTLGGLCVCFLLVLISRVWNVSYNMFMYKLRVFYAILIYVSVLWIAIALNITTKLEKRNQFTSARPGNLTTSNLPSSTSYHSQHFEPHPRKFTAVQEQNRSFRIFSSEVSSVISVVSSCSGHCSRVRQAAVFRPKLKEGGPFAAFYKVYVMYSGAYISGDATQRNSHIERRC